MCCFIVIVEGIVYDESLSCGCGNRLTTLDEILRAARVSCAFVDCELDT